MVEIIAPTHVCMGFVQSNERGPVPYVARYDAHNQHYNKIKRIETRTKCPARRRHRLINLVCSLRSGIFILSFEAHSHTHAPMSNNYNFGRN